MAFQKRLAALLLAGVLLLSGCSPQPGGRMDPGGSPSASTAGEAPAMGRYIEEECALPEGLPIQALHETEAGELECFVSPQSAAEGWGVYRSSDQGKSWKKQEIPALQAAGEEAWRVTDAQFGSGGLYLLYYRPDLELEARRAEKERRGERVDFAADYPQNRLAVFPAGGGMTQVDLAFEDADGMAGSELMLEISETGDILCASYCTLYQFDSQTGEVLHRFETENQIFSFAAQGRLACVMAYDAREIRCFNLETGEEEEDVAPGQGIESGDILLASSRSPDVLLLSEKTGLYRHVLGGSVWERLVDGELTSLNLPSLRGRLLLEAADGSYYLLSARRMDGGGSQTLYRYAYSPGVPTVPQGELNVYSLSDNDTVRQAMGEWQRRNPDMRVVYQLGMDGSDAVTRSDALRALNTALLAGKGPDLLILDGLPYRSYVEKGVLLDLQPFLEPKLQQGELLENVARTYWQEGTLFAVPARFGVPQLWISEEGGKESETLESFSRWAARQQTGENERLLIDTTPEGLIKTFYIACLPAWREADGRLKAEPLAAFLEAVGRIASDAEQESASLPEDLGSPISLLGISFATGSLFALPGVSQGFSDAEGPFAGIGTMRDGVCLPMPGQAEGVYVPQTVLGINARSDRQEQALELIDIILSEPVQSLEFEDGYAVNAAAFEQGWHDPYKENPNRLHVVFSSRNPETGEEYSLDVAWPDETFMQQMAAGIRELHTPSEEDPVLLEMLLEETKGFFEGNKTVEEAVSAVIKRAETYLAE